MTGLSLVVRSVSLDGGEFNWVFLIWYIVTTVLTILFLFYFNRVFASLVTCGIRAYLWHYHRVDVHVHALQVSLLAGRVFFKNVRYHGQNQTILIHDGYITWRYWLRHVQQLEAQTPQASQRTATQDDQASKEEDTTRVSTKPVEAGREIKPRHLPCRVLLKARGVEWFIYNRSPAYDAIFRSMTEKEPLEHAGETSAPYGQSDSSTQRSHGVSDRAKDYCYSGTRDDEKYDDTVNSENSTSISTNSSAVKFDSTSEPLPGLLKMLPIGVECGKGAMVMGNRNTRSILTAKFESATGKIDARECSFLDRYKQTFDFDFVHPIVELKPNKDYMEQQVSEGAKLHSPSTSTFDRTGKSHYSGHLDYRNRVRQALNTLRGFAPYRTGSVESFNNPHLKSYMAPKRNKDTAGEHGQSRWLGLSRYLDDDDDFLEQERWRAVEYGQFTTICDSPNISMSFHWDVPGFVRESTRSDLRALPSIETDINGEPPPEYGIELKIGGGTIHYGPWADRQRSDLQTVFFPALYRDSSPSARLTPGQRRVSTVLEIVLEMEESTTLRVPTREESKDWRWRGHKFPSAATGAKNKKTKHQGKAGKGKQPAQSAEIRPHGWLDVRVLPDSTVSFSMALLAGNNGYQNRVDLDLKGLEVSSSVNHGLLLRSKSQAISCDLSNPLTWNTLHRWHIDICDNETELFILRDHMFLITDLISDWTSGPPGSFHTFVPFEYTIGLSLSDFKLYLNANDSNIINNPSDFEDNTFIIFCGKKPKANVTIPARTFRPARNRVNFDFHVSNGNLLLHTPPWNTQRTFLKSPNVGSLRDLHVKGSYDYFTTTSPSLTDILFMDVHGVSPRMNLYGFLIRYLMKIKDNYFGEDIHFRTLEEYQAQLNRSIGQDSANPSSLQHNRISNDLDVILGIAVEHLCVLLPAQLYSSDENVRLESLSVTTDLRITNYYMDCIVSSSPIALSNTCHVEKLNQDNETYSSTQIFIDGIQVFGHRLFGLPPTEPTYVCNWDFDVGSATGECSIEFVRHLTISLRCFGLTFDDAENALPPFHPILVHDTTFFRLRVQPLAIGICMEHAGFVLGTGKVEVDFNDWAGALFSDRLRILVQNLTFAVVDAPGASTDGVSARGPTNTHAYLRTTVGIHGVNRKRYFKVDRQLQQSHMALHDSRTHRVPWLVHKNDIHGISEAATHFNKTRPPAMPFPSMPEPNSAISLTANDAGSSISALAGSDSSTSSSARSSSFLMDAFSKREKARMNDSHKEELPHVKQEASQTSMTSKRHVKTSLLAENRSAYDSSHEAASSPSEYSYSGLSFSSPYKKPYFPLLAVNADTKDLPSLPQHLLCDHFANDIDALESLKNHDANRDTQQSSFMVDLSYGVSAFCNPEALSLMTETIAAFQASDVVALLDNLQIDAITDVLSARKAHEGESRTTDVRIFVPHLAVRFFNKTKSESMGTDPQDRYDVSLDHLTATASFSSRLPRTPPATRLPQYSIHVAINHIDCSARQSVGGNSDNQAIISLSVDDPIFWMMYRTTATAEMQFEKLEVASTSRKVDYVSSLIRKTLLLIEDLAARFIKLEQGRKSRIRYLVHLLAREGDKNPDPPFLTRASYVLRSASHHLRSSDSWRQISHLRHTYHSLPEESQSSITNKCTQEMGSCPQDAGQHVASSFHRRQIMEPSQTEYNFLMQRVYGECLEPNKSVSDVRIPFKATIKAGVIQILLKPGRKQNEIAIKGLIVGIAIDQSPITDTAPSCDESDTVNDIVQVHCMEIAARLNWTLLELLENIIETLPTTRRPRPQETRASLKSQALLDHQCLHIVVSSEMTILNCETPNLKVVSLCHGLQTSMMMLKDGSAHGQSISVAVNADIATSEIKTHSVMLTLYKLAHPKIFGSRHGAASKNVGETWKLNGTGQDVSFQVFANPLQLIEAADSFLEQEVAYITNWTRSLRAAQVTAPTASNSSRQNSLPRVQVTLSLESYLISVGILPSLIYQISGTRGYSSVKLGLCGNHSLSFGFGLNEHLHTFETRGSDGENRKVLSTLQMPPINGRLLLDLSPGKKLIDFRGLIENIVFDASAVHAVLSALNRPEIVSFARSIRNEVSIFQAHYEDIFNTAAAEPDPQFSKLTFYNVNITLSSLAINARTLDALNLNRGAELHFILRRMRLKTTNKVASAESVNPFPELEVQCSGIDLDLLRFEGSSGLPCGSIVLKVLLRSTSRANDSGEYVRSHQIRSSSLQINVYSETAPTIVAILAHLQDTLRSIDLSQEVQNLKKLGHKRLKRKGSSVQAIKTEEGSQAGTAVLFGAMYSLEMTNISAIWRIEDLVPTSAIREPENLMLSLTKIDLTTRKDNAARLLIENLQLQMAPISETSVVRSLNSALLPEVLFNVAYISTMQDRRLAFQVVGKSLDLQLTSQFILPANDIRRSMALSIQQVRAATADWTASAPRSDGQSRRLTGDKKLSSLLVDADFSGAVVYVQGQGVAGHHIMAPNGLRSGRLPHHGRYNQFTPENAHNSSTTLRAPGVAFKVEYKNTDLEGQSLQAETKVDASSNILYPRVVPLIMEVSSTVKDIVGESDEQKQSTTISPPQLKLLEDERLRGADPTTILGDCRLNLGLRICRQEFSLSCQPIARVAATARSDDIYIAVNTVQSQEHGKFFTVSAACTRLQASVQHVYSRESTGSFEVDSIVVSLMNSKHVSSANGISAIINVSPMKAQINGKQLQDFLLFREIWMPPDIRRSTQAAAPAPVSESQAFIVQRYQQIAAAGAFPWNATVSIAKLDVQVDLGQSLGKSALEISNLWTSSKKTSDWEQNLCLGFDRIAVDSTGRMSGYIELKNFRMRTSIQWRVTEQAQDQTPLVQASFAFDHLRVKAAFDYQAFAVADITTFKFLMYNVRDPQNARRDRLVGVLDGDKVQVFCTTTSASQSIALYQAFQRLYQEKRAAYQASLRDIESFLHRKSSINPSSTRTAVKRQEDANVESIRSSLKLQTDVVVTLKAVKIGSFPSTFFDNQVFKLEAHDASARFAVVLVNETIHSTLGMSLGQLRIALSGITRTSFPKILSEISVADVVTSATGSRGGTILKVPRLIATMETWQSPESTNVDYIFKSSFQGRVDVGWNYSRISYIRGMWASHARALAQRLGKPLPQSAVQISGGPRPQGEDGDQSYAENEEGRITAVVNVPQSKYSYTALQPPVIETPQLRDMGEATPPLEWIGLHRERLPNLTHQIVIVTLLEVAKEVDDAYSRILGSS